jgi:hypothetical protein
MEELTLCKALLDAVSRHEDVKWMEMEVTTIQRVFGGEGGREKAFRHFEETIDACPVRGRIHMKVESGKLFGQWESLVGWAQVGFVNLTEAV